MYVFFISGERILYSKLRLYFFFKFLSLFLDFKLNWKKYGFVIFWFDKIRLSLLRLVKYYICIYKIEKESVKLKFSWYCCGR